jgi:CRP-like cAMP-binding protein/thioredoxin reductase/Fe-S-cluster-containing hydrogenase component 2
MAEQVAVAIVGSGPAGLSAAAHAAACGLSHVLLEQREHISDTIHKYQKGKLVMATPDVLPLRSDLTFQMSSREEVLNAWRNGIDRRKVNIRYRAEVAAIKGERGSFTLKLKDGAEIGADHVVLAIGLQGNIRKIGVPGQERDWVQYQLDDPDEYSGETIVVVGAGDAAIENALALTKQNNVLMINRGDEFARAKQGNLTAINAAIEKGSIECVFNATTVQIDDDGIVVKTPQGETKIRCDRVIARLGALPPRKFVEDCGVKFLTPDPSSPPGLSPQYETNVPGLYVVGALAGYPLIKQAMNQGYEVIEYIQGKAIKPADEPILEQKFAPIPGGRTVSEILDYIQQSVPLLSGLNTLQLRELLLESEIHAPRGGAIVFERNDYTNSFYSIVDGGVNIQVDPQDETKVVALGKGAFFGEMGLLSGRRRTATVMANSPSLLIETPRRTMIKLISSVESVKRVMDEVAVGRQIQTYIAPDIPMQELEELIHTVKVEKFDQGAVLFRQGDPGDCLYLIQRGSVTVSSESGGKETIISYVPAGNYVGEMALISNAPRSATIRAAVPVEALRLDGESFRALMRRNDNVRRSIEARYRGRMLQNIETTEQSESGGMIQFLIEQGLGEATDVLLIDEALCVRCDNCEKACAETHQGTSRLDREAGPTYQTIHVPTSCRHCEHPHCMADCPPDALRRNLNGEVYITDSCIGCGNCERNCPYGVIHMAAKAAKKPGLLQWLLFGRGPGPGEAVTGKWGPDRKGGGDAPKKAVKCDMCKDIEGGPACVRACPTGAALRVKPEEFFTAVSQG